MHLLLQNLRPARRRAARQPSARPRSVKRTGARIGPGAALPLGQGLAITLSTALAAIVILSLADGGSQRAVETARAGTAPHGAARPHVAQQHVRSESARPLRSIPVAPVVPRSQPRVGTVVFHLVDPSRTVRVSGRSTPRSFDTLVRYPIGISGLFPLIVFGHGYSVTPAPYSSLLDAWTKAGYVVAAPIFPLENANAPGGPNENDLVNQPGDMSLVISNLLRPTTPTVARIASLIDARNVAVAGQSDGGDTALAAAYDPSARDRRITAAIILSGAEDPFARPFAMPAGGPPLLAIQGTADTINPPNQTYAFFQSASRPKYLLKLLGAGHQPPYTEPGPELTTVEHMTLTFLNYYFKGRPRAFPQPTAPGSVGSPSVLIAQR